MAETAQHPRFGFGHAWSRTAGYSLTTAPERLYLVLTMEGGFDFTVDGSTVSAEPGSLILLDGEAPTLARTTTETARFVWYLEPTFLRPGHSRFRHGEPIATGGSTITALTAMTNSLLRTPPSASPTTERHLTLAFENLLAGVLHEAGPSRQAAPEHRDGLFMAALRAIEQNFRDPAFNATRLATEISVSQRTLYNTFGTMGTTPRREIERRRIDEADRLRQESNISAAELAARAGFTSTRQLTRALVRNRAT
ncbi:MAG: AraC family transcriptional regulator [Leifsonia sp.]